MALGPRRPKRFPGLRHISPHPSRGESANPDENGAVWKKSPEVKLKWHHIILVSGQCNSACFTPETPTPSAPFLWQAFYKTALNFPQINNSYFSYHKYNCHFIYCIHIPFKYIKVSVKTTRTKTSGLLFIQYWWGNLNQSRLDLRIVDVNCFEKKKKLLHDGTIPVTFTLKCKSTDQS